MSQIAAWLARLGLSKYAEAFAAHEVDFEVLRHLSDDDLKELGLPSDRGAKFWPRSRRRPTKKRKQGQRLFLPPAVKRSVGSSLSCLWT
ncbi:MAG: hypothetical protein E6G89_14755 [Alphaproteobacteria bacterium]|nr:MAG: hypothetical protein E6G89_14755 [Alphaproteobacteria bacterium]